VATETEIKRYWNERAAANDGSPAATTDDIHLRDLEIHVIARELLALALPAGSCVLDAGCGDGFSTIGVAQALPDLRFRGIDYSEAMIENARAGLSGSGVEGRVEFDVGDVTALGDAVGETRFAAVITDRVLINLTSFEAQVEALRAIADCLAPGGTYIAIENFMDGQEQLTLARAAVGLPEIPVRWHNRYLQESDFRRVAEESFGDVRFESFASSYYFATRVVYSAMCAMRGEQPDYDHEIHRLAPRLPSVGNFSPICLVVMRKSAESTAPSSAD
jgi:SAM-dependent methyltransferase